MKNRIINYFAFTVLTLMWLGFGAAILFNREMLTAVWQSFLSWPVIGQLSAGLLALPIVLGLWVWETAWPLWIRLILVIGLAWVTVYTFFPRKAKQEMEAAAVKN